jgi:AcrR family transcriptional regulator
MPKIVNHETYKEELLEKGFDLFANKGYTITIRELASGLGVSTGTLYHYFSGKEDMFRETMEHIAKKHVGNIKNQIQPDWSTEDRARAIFIYVNMNDDYFKNILFLLIEYHKQNGGVDKDGIISKIAGLIRKILQEQLNFQNETESTTLLSFFIGHILQKKLDPMGSVYPMQGLELIKIFMAIK